MAAWSRKTLKIVAKKLPFLEKWPLMVKFSTFCSEGIHQDTHRSTCYVQISWNLADRKLVKKCVTYRARKAKFRLALPLSLLRGLRPKSARISSGHCTHPNRFTFGRVIAERMNTIEACDKVFPIFGWSLGSSRMTIWVGRNVSAVKSLMQLCTV